MVALMVAASAGQAALTFDFDDGTAQGWTEIMGGSTAFAVVTVAGDVSPHEGDYFCGQAPDNFDNNPSTLIWRSPSFVLDGSGDLTAYLKKGQEGDPPPATSADISPSSIWGTDGFVGIALRRVSDDTYVLWEGRTSDGNPWQQVDLSAAELAPYVGSTAYTLDFIDYRRGSWGWICMDTVSIPGYTTWGNAGVSNITTTAADAYATLINTNVTSGYLYWDTTDRGENLTWAYTNVLSSLSTGLVESTISGLTPDTTYYARFYDNTAEPGGWSDAISFNTALAPTSYRYWMQISFTNFAGRGTLTNFPALVKFNTSDNFYDGFTSADAHDLRFCNEDGTGVLNYEIEKWNTNGESFVWVQVPELVNNCSIWAYWGNPDAVQPAYTTNGATWDANFRGVWHLNDTNSAGKLPDSTGNPNDGVNNGTVNVENEVIGDAQLFTDDYIDCGTDPSLDLTSALTVSAWGYFENSDHAGFVYAGGGWSTAGYGLHVFGNLRAELRDGGSATAVDNPKPTEDQWTHVTLTWDTSDETIRVYYDGVLQGNTGTRTAVNPIGTNFKIGRANSGNFDGMIDEVRAEAVARSSDWIWACYQNQGANHASFVEYGNVVRRPEGTMISIR